MNWGTRSYRKLAARTAAALVAATALSLPAAAQFNIGDRFANAIEAMHSGIDSIWPEDLKLDGMTARVGLGIGFTPDYIGSGDYRLRVLPVLDIRYKERWRLNGSLLTYAAVNKGPWQAGPLVSLAFGRPESRNEVLRGIQEVETTLEAGAFARYQTTSGLVSLDYRHALGNGLGGSFRFTVGHGIYKSGNFVTIVGARARWLSNKAMQRNFGLTQQDSQNSEFGLPAFAARSGVSEVSANVIGAYRLNDRVRVLSLLSVGHLLGDAKNSPLVSGENGSPLQVIFGVGFTTQF